eukprot:2532746-Rhodomonas_salina.4
MGVRLERLEGELGRERERAEEEQRAAQREERGLREETEQLREELGEKSKKREVASVSCDDGSEHVQCSTRFQR